MNPATFALIVQGLQALLIAAPGVVSVADKVRGLIDDLFTEKLITKNQQDTVRAHVDAICAAHLNGATPPEWTVESDPQ